MKKDTTKEIEGEYVCRWHEIPYRERCPECKKTRATHAMEWLMKQMPKDTISNLGLNESYRMGLEDMVDWIDGVDLNEPLTGGRTNPPKA